MECGMRSVTGHHEATWRGVFGAFRPVQMREIIKIGGEEGDSFKLASCDVIKRKIIIWLLIPWK